MNNPNFPGRDKLVAAFDAAVAQGDAHVVTASLRDALCRLSRDPDVKLPDCVLAPISDHYARRELYRSEPYGYSVIAMTWGPSQGTPIHDHAGRWCVECVWRGQIEIEQYELLEQQEPRFRFHKADTLRADVGSAGSLIPPHEYHTIRNPSPRDVAVSLHIYQAPMMACSVFRPLGESWYLRDSCSLALDKVA